MAEYVAVGDKFTSPGFSPSNYVKDLVQNSVRIDAILSERQQIANLADETNNLLKKNVYKNYMQFIETAKEISYLESEMYQLSHMLTEQQNVMQSLLEISITDSKGSTNNVSTSEKKEEDPRRNISTLLEKVEGCTHILDVKDRHIVHSGEVNELKEDQSTSKIYAVLLSDCLVLADWLPHRRGPVQYRFQVAYELDNLAVVNVSEDQKNTNSFKILMFPHTRLFQCETAAEKRTWMEIIEQTKQAKMAAVTLRRESALLDPKGSLLGDDSNREFLAVSTTCYRTGKMFSVKNVEGCYRTCTEAREMKQIKSLLCLVCLKIWSFTARVAGAHHLIAVAPRTTMSSNARAEEQLVRTPITSFEVSPELLRSKKYATIQLNCVNNAIFVMKTDANRTRRTVHFFHKFNISYSYFIERTVLSVFVPEVLFFCVVQVAASYFLICKCVLPSNLCSFCGVGQGPAAQLREGLLESCVHHPSLAVRGHRVYPGCPHAL
ncbi:unnamed protein product [Ixodes pacificus]